MNVLHSPRLALAILVAISIFSARSEDENFYCRVDRTLFAPPESAEGLKYAPNREISIQHLAIDITPDFKAQSIEGKVTLRFKPIAKSLEELHLNAMNLNIHSVTSAEKIKAWQNTDREVIINFAPPIPADHDSSVTIAYSAYPKEGLYFRTPDMGYKPGDTHLWTQGESEGNRYWFPSFDAPNQKFTSEVTCRVPEGMTVLSNGKKMSEEKDSITGLVAFRWLQDKPHVNYLIFLAAGTFKGIHDTYNKIPLAFYTPASDIAYASNSFEGTKDMLAFYEKETGVPYPWDKYDQVCVNDFSAGGMENTSITCLNDSTLHTADFEGLRSSEGLIAHELVHQWFGDLVTCKDWPNIWLNEGFATYYEHLYYGYKHGQDALRIRLYQDAKHLATITGNPMVRRNYRGPDELFDGLAYGKGAWILHMLRCQLGVELYQKCIKTYLERFQFKNVTTEEFKAVLDEVSGRSFDQFFDQYVFHAGAPELTVNYSWDEKTKLARVSIQQVQQTNNQVLLFNVPLTIRFKMKDLSTIDRSVPVKEKTQDFYFPLSEAPEIVRIDPEVTVLAKINFTPPNAMLYSQLADKKDTVGRLMAVEQLSGKKEALDKLKDILNNDSSHDVRLAACRSIRAIQGEETLDALLGSLKQNDARVRKQVISDICSFYGEKTYRACLDILQEEKNPDIRAVCVTAIGTYPKSEIRDRLLTTLETDSFHNILGDAAIAGMRAQDDVSYLKPVLQRLKKNETAFTTGGYAKGLETIAWFARNEDKKDNVRDLLLKQLDSKKKRVRLAAINALGTLGDQKAIAPLEVITRDPKQTPERGAAERALSSLRDGRKPSVELGTIRNEVLNLQKENRELRKQLEDLKKKVDEKPTAPAVTPAATKTGVKEGPK